MLTITTGGSTPAGTYAVQIQGSAGLVTNGATLSLVVQAAPDFTIGPGSGPTSQTISPGQSTSFSLTLATLGSFSATVNLSCSITPTVSAGPTCNLPSSVQISGGEVQPLVVTVATSDIVASATLFYAPHSPTRTVQLAGLLMLLGLVGLLPRRRQRALIATLPVIALPVAFLLWMVSCSGSSSHASSETPPGTYQVTITASSGSLIHNTVVQVVVQQ